MQNLKNTKLVSVVVASYNMGKYLSSAVQSILDQSYPSLEIHVVDDGSTDDTKKVMKHFENDDRVNYHYQSNQGQAKAKNKGIMASKGDYIAFLDADDMWSKTKLEKQMPCFEINENIGLVHTNFVLMDENEKMLGTVPRKYYNGKVTEQLLITNFVNGMASVVKKECLEKVGIFDESLPMGIDWDLWLRISTEYEIYFLDEKAYFYRQWEGQMSHNQEKRYECAARIMSKFLSQYPGLVNKSVENEAWANLYVGRAYGYFLDENNKLDAIKYFAKALKTKRNYMQAWKGLVKILINRK